MIRLTTMTKMDMTSTQPWTMGKSRCPSAVTRLLPMPGMLKMVSKMTLPPTSAATEPPMMVMTGIMHCGKHGGTGLASA